jgi:hypothetical protein
LFLERDLVSYDSYFLNLLKNRINLIEIPFTERGSRLLVFRSADTLSFRLAERWFKREAQLLAYRERPPMVEIQDYLNRGANL